MDLPLNSSIRAGPAAPLRPLDGGALDRMLGGGLARGAVHEIAPAAFLHTRAATGFALALARGPAPGRLVWIQQHMAGVDCGLPYGPGLGDAAPHLLFVRARDRKQALWAAEESLHSRAVLAVLLEIAGDAPLGLIATRRLSLAAQEHDGQCFILRPRVLAEPSACATRWSVAAAPSRPDRFGGLGRPRFALSLTKNRRGPCGDFLFEWNEHAGLFTADPLALAAAACDRSRAPQRRIA